MEQQMPQGQPVPPGGPTAKKGMSTGCIVALVIVGVLIILIVVAGLVCYMKRGDIVAYGVNAMVDEVRNKAAQDVQPGVDTVAVNRVTDAFIARVNSEEEVNAERLAVLIQDIQPIVADNVVDSAEAEDFMLSMAEIYPELEGQLPDDVKFKFGPPPVLDTTEMIDTTMR